MSRLILHRVALSAAALLLATCGRNEPSWVNLTSDQNLPYTVSIKTYGGDEADKPFDIKLSSKRAQGIESTIILTSQCKNVRVLPRRDYFYIFYDELALRGYSAFRYDASLPRPFLCDLRHQFCSELLRTAISGKESVSSACSYA